VTHITCRSCGAPILLDPARVTRRPTHAEVICPACDATVAVRLIDADRAALAGVWSVACYADDEEPATGHRRPHWWRRAS